MGGAEHAQLRADLGELGCCRQPVDPWDVAGGPASPRGLPAAPAWRSRRRSSAPAVRLPLPSDLRAGSSVIRPHEARGPTLGASRTLCETPKWVRAVRTPDRQARLGDEFQLVARGEFHFGASPCGNRNRRVELSRLDAMATRSPKPCERSVSLTGFMMFRSCRTVANRSVAPSARALEWATVRCARWSWTAGRAGAATHAAGHGTAARQRCRHRYEIVRAFRSTMGGGDIGVAAAPGPGREPLHRYRACMRAFGKRFHTERRDDAARPAWIFRE